MNYLIRPFFFRWIVAAFFIVSVPFSFSAEQSAVESLADRLKPMESLTASFSQTITDDRNELMQDAQGVLAVKRPRKFYWLTEQPYEHLVVTDGVVLWQYDIDLEQITKQAFTADLDKAPALLLSGDIEQISRQFSVEMQVISDTADRFTLTPLIEDGLFKKLTIVFGSEGLVSMSLLDNFDQLTDIQFSDVVLNPDVTDQQFEFVPPGDVDVIVNDEP
ncbi:MAG: outer membrane lipoprotein chaperone LolA [Oceanicoccus sp.]